MPPRRERCQAAGSAALSDRFLPALGQVRIGIGTASFRPGTQPLAGRRRPGLRLLEQRPTRRQLLALAQNSPRAVARQPVVQPVRSFPSIALATKADENRVSGAREPEKTSIKGRTSEAPIVLRPCHRFGFRGPRWSRLVSRPRWATSYAGNPRLPAAPAAPEADDDRYRPRADCRACPARGKNRVVARIIEMSARRGSPVAPVKIKWAYCVVDGDGRSEPSRQAFSRSDPKRPKSGPRRDPV